jgi:hypothetical protein
MGNIPSGLAKAAPIHEAAATDNVPKLVLLLAEGEDIDSVDGVSCFRWRMLGVSFSSQDARHCRPAWATRTPI